MEWSPDDCRLPLGAHQLCGSLHDVAHGSIVLAGDSLMANRYIELTRLTLPCPCQGMHSALSSFCSLWNAEASSIEGKPQQYARKHPRPAECDSIAAQPGRRMGEGGGARGRRAARHQALSRRERGMRTTLEFAGLGNGGAWERQSLWRRLCHYGRHAETTNSTTVASTAAAEATACTEPCKQNVCCRAAPQAHAQRRRGRRGRRGRDERPGGTSRVAGAGPSTSMDARAVDTQFWELSSDVDASVASLRERLRAMRAHGQQLPSAFVINVGAHLLNPLHSKSAYSSYATRYVQLLRDEARAHDGAAPPLVLWLSMASSNPSLKPERFRKIQAPRAIREWNSAARGALAATFGCGSGFGHLDIFPVSHQVARQLSLDGTHFADEVKHAENLLLLNALWLMRRGDTSLCAAR